jgi:hypothetical protein
MKRRRQGSGSLRLNGRTWRLQYYVRGQCIQENSGTEDRSVAEELLKHRLAEVALGDLDGIICSLAYAVVLKRWQAAGIPPVSKYFHLKRQQKKVSTKYRAPLPSGRSARRRQAVVSGSRIAARAAR